VKPLAIGLLVESLHADRYAEELALWIKRPGAGPVRRG